MALLAPIQLGDQDKLKVLQRLDQYRRWRSLDEQRYCLVCSKIIAGSEIQVVGGTRGTGPLRIICPTPRCHSIPMDWVALTDEMIASAAMQENKLCQVFVVPGFERSKRPRGSDKSSLTKSLRRFAAHFKRSAG
jgi:hypothetical protein